MSGFAGGEGRKITKRVGRFELALYKGEGTCIANNFPDMERGHKIELGKPMPILSVVRAWRVGYESSSVRDVPWVSWQLYEGDYEQALAFFKALESENEVESLCARNPRNPRQTASQSAQEYKKGDD